MINNFIKTLLVLGLTALLNVAYAAPIQRTITIDGDMADWKSATPMGPDDITTNPGQFSTDEEGDASTGSAADLDFEVQSVGRDLKRFSYTFDDDNLYLWVGRFASSSNITDWWFYLETDNDGVMESGEKVLRVQWRGSNGNTTVRLYDYVAAQSGGDTMLCPATGTYSVASGWCPQAGVADGYDLPGTQGFEHTLLTANGDEQDQHGGNTSGAYDGLEMETRISWAALGLSGPASLGFHISSSNGSNIPTQINDNMEGLGGGGGGIAFSELAVTKSASVTSVNAGSTFSYSVTVTNNGDSAATNVTLNDVLPSGVSYVSHVSPTGTTYDSATGVWTIGSLPYPGTKTLNITVLAKEVATDTVVTNTANNLLLDQGDPDTTNNEASVDVTVIAVPIISLLKSAQTIQDPVNGTSNPKAIPGALAEYTIAAINTGLASADNNTIIITDAIPANTALYVNDISGPATGPVRFIDGSPPSGLSLGSVSYSNNGGTSYGYVPSADVDGVDTTVTNIRISTLGQFLASSGSGDPSFKLLFRVKVQ